MKAFGRILCGLIGAMGVFFAGYLGPLGWGSNATKSHATKSNAIKSNATKSNATKSNAPCASSPSPGKTACHPLSSIHGVLKFKEVNWRSGPGHEHPVKWTYRSPGYPVVIIRQWGYWYFIEDWEKYSGWVHKNLLCFRRGILVMDDKTPLYQSPHDQSPIVGYVSKGVYGRLHRQKEGWYCVSFPQAKGWVQEKNCWNPLMPPSP